MPPRIILKEIRSGPNTNELQKKHLLTHKKIYNISQKYGVLYRHRFHNTDAVSVDMMVNNYNKHSPEPVLFYKLQDTEHPEYPQLNKDDFLLIVCTNTQAAMLKRFRSNKICVEATHGTNAYKLNFTTIVVIDEFGEGFPVAICISN